MLVFSDNMSAIDSLSDSSDSVDTMGNFPEKERDPSSIDFSFLKAGIKFWEILPSSFNFNFNFSWKMALNSFRNLG